MARRIKSANLDTRSARNGLTPRAKPYWQRLDRELHLGYRKGKQGGQWVRRIYIGNQQYDTDTFAAADDRSDANGVSVLDWAQAQEKARELRDAFVRRQAGIAEPKAAYTVAKAVEDYIANRRAKKGETTAKYALGRLRKHGLLKQLGDKPLAELTAAELRDWHNGMVRVAQDPDDEDELEDERCSRDSANRVLAHAKAAFNLAFDNEHVDEDKAWRRVKPFEAVGEARKVILTDAQRQNLLDASEPDLREFALLTARTGARPGKELTEARVRDFDPEEKILTVRGKTGQRDIPVDDPDTLRQLRKLASGKRPADYLLLKADGQPWKKSEQQRPVAAAVKKAGLDPATCLYSLRHTYITNSLKKGTPEGAVAKHCGTSAAMIQKYYAKWIKSDLARYAKKAAPKLRDEPAEKVAKLRAVA